MSRGREATRIVRAGIAQDTAHGAVMPPIYLSANYTFAGLGKKRQYDYSRTANPTRDQLAGALSDLEGGAGAVITASGMAAITAVVQLLGPDDLLIAPPDCYGGTYRLLTALAARGQFRLQFLDLTGDEAVATFAGMRPRVVWVETPSNPLLRITDLEAVCRVTHDAGGLVVVDNTLLSPALQRPLQLGADVVVHSTTKFINGHSDVVGGAAIAADAAIAESIAWWTNCLGLSGAPFDAYLTLRGLRTLEARTRIHLENAAAVVAALTGHEAVERVHYPGLSSHRGHAIAARQQLGFGSMISFELGPDLDVASFLDRLEHFCLAESLGGVESLVAHPATMTHAAMDAEARATAGIGDRLLRLSVGIEDGRDLVEDLVRALDASVKGPAGRFDRSQHERRSVCAAR